jgi:hypothetical protein
MQKYWALLALLLVFGSSYALAAPAELRFNNVLPGGFSEITLPITSNESTAVMLSTAGPAAKWVTVSPSQGYANANFPLKASVTVKPPAEALPGTYIAYVITDQPNSDSATSYIAFAYTTKIFIKITTTQLSQAQVKSLDILRQENRILGLADVENTGNVNITPSFALGISGQNLAASSSATILPGRSATIRAEIDTSTLAGNVYPVGAAVYVQDKLLSQNSVSVSFENFPVGKLLNASLSEFVVGKPAQITALFENTGTSAVSAQLRSDINHNNETESAKGENIVVQPGQIANLTDYFFTRESGTYNISNYVVFGSSATNEVLINAEAQEAVPLSLSAMSLLLFAVVALVLFLFAKRPKRKLSTRGGK